MHGTALGPNPRTIGPRAGLGGDSAHVRFDPHRSRLGGRVCGVLPGVPVRLMQAVSRVGEVPLAEREGVPQLWQVPRIGSTKKAVQLEGALVGCVRSSPSANAPDSFLGDERALAVRGVVQVAPLAACVCAEALAWSLCWQPRSHHGGKRHTPKSSRWRAGCG